MKVAELIEQLSDLDPKAEVVLSSDGEGNSYSELATIEFNLLFVGPWPGEVWPADYDEDWYNDREHYKATKADSVSAIVLYPTR